MHPSDKPGPSPHGSEPIPNEKPESFSSPPAPPGRSRPTAPAEDPPPPPAEEEPVSVLLASEAGASHEELPAPSMSLGPKPVDAQRAWSSEHAPPDEAIDEPPPVPGEAVQPAEELLPPSIEPPVLRAGIPPMYIVQICSELAPVAKVGGLGDVVFGLTRELAIRGNDVETILPKYDCLRYDHISDLHVVWNDLWVPWWGGRIHCSVWYGTVHGRKCFFIEPHSRDNFFNRGKFYGDHDDVLRFAFFSRAAMEFLYKSGRHADVIHCHDWQTALVPVFLWEIYQHFGMRHPRVCYTIHNFTHQGVTGEFLLWATELGRSPYYFHHDRLRDNRNPHALNLMKGGIVYSNFVTTVSPNHAWEAKADQGHGLEQTLHVHHLKYGGVVNGVDYDVWNPEVDRYLPVRYGTGNIEHKYDNKRALRHRFWLAESAKPIVAYIGRLDQQKGLELIRNAVWWSIQHEAQFVLLGTAPDPRVGHEFWELKRRLNESPDCHIELSFNDELSHLIYAGTDMIVVPSRFEPCGLTQLIAMKYGTVPIVRAVGGLADTVYDKDYDWRPLDQRNGYVFQHYTQHALESTMARAVSCYYQFPDHFRQLMLNGMRADHSWTLPAQHYLNIYDYVRDK